HPRWQRFIIAIAGPAMNVVLAVVVMTGVFAVHYTHPWYLDQPAVISTTLEGSPADKVGLKSGDRIVRIDGIENPTWEKVLYKEALSANQPLNLQIERDHSVFSMTVVPAATHDGGGQAGWDPAEPNTVSDLDPKMPAAKAGLRVGDDVVALNGEVVRSTNA